MWIVQIALRRPYTFIVMALLILLSTPLVLSKMATDIFPEINIPVVSIIWNYSGLSAQEMGQRITAANERRLTTTVNDIEHIESQSVAGISIIKIFFQPTANIQTAIAQTVSIEQAQLRALPPGITPPLIIKYSASSIPVIQLGLSSSTMTEQALGDTALNFLRPQLITIPGAAIPYPYGGKSRLISVDLDTQALLAKGLTPTDVVNAVNAQNLALPSGTAKIGATEFNVSMNGSPDTVEGLNNIPVLSKNGATTYISEVARVRDGFSPQTNIVRQDGHRGVLLSILKNGGSSTLDIVNTLRGMLPTIMQNMPADLKIQPLFDQSLFVKAAISGVIREALIAACLTAAIDSGIPRQLAQHLHHCGVDPAVHPVVDPGALCAGRNHQHHDVGRAGARGGNIGRRCHRHHRKHRTPFASGIGPAQGNPRRRRRNRGAGAGLDALYLYRVRADVLPGRRGALPVRAAGRSGGVRHAGILCVVAYAGTDHGDADDGSRSMAIRMPSRACCNGCIGASMPASRNFAAATF